MKYSRQRELIQQAVCTQLDHPTADQVYQLVRQAHPNISLGTIYRNLNQLVEIGQLRKLTLGEGYDRFDGQLHEHYHMLCTECGRVIDLPLPKLAELDQFLLRQYGFAAEEKELVVHGRCQQCRNQSDPAIQ